MEVLSEVLKAVKLDGALFYNAEFSAPWCFCSPASSTLAPYLSTNSRHVIIFHLLTESRGYAQVEGGRPAAFAQRRRPCRFPAWRSTRHEKRTTHQTGGPCEGGATNSLSRH